MPNQVKPLLEGQGMTDAEWKADLARRIAALPPVKEVDGQVYHRGESGVYVQAVERIEQLNREEWLHHLATHVGCRDERSAWYQNQKGKHK